MLLAALYRIVLEMRRSYAASGAVTRSQAQMLKVGLSRADTMYPALAANIRDDDVGCRTILDVAAKAIVEDSSFTEAWTAESPSYTLAPSALGFFDAAMAVSLG